ncbi:MAG: restriction endonuclease subunit S [Smithella sp.]|nr:restriction endonuclease subunit S [Smithella sp.]
MKIKDVVKINELNINSKYPYSEIEYIDTASLTEGRFEKIQHIQLKDAPSRAKRIVRHNDILISTVRPNLKHYGIAKNPSSKTVASTGFAVITCKKICPDYLYHLLTTNWYTDFLSGIAESQQSNYPAFNPSLIENTTIDLPELPIQRKIAAVLSAYDDLIENNNRRIAILERMAEELYREWFVRLRFPGHEKVKIVKGVPEGWEVKRIGDILSFKYGYTESAIEDNQYPKFLRVMDINKTSYIKWSEVPNCKIDENEKEKYLLKKSDLVIARMASPGKVAIIERDINAVFASYLIKMTLDINNILPYYAFYTLTNDYYQGLFSNADTSSTRGNINGQIISRFQIIIPPLELQKLFEKQILSIRNTLNNFVIQNETLTIIRDRLLTRLMSGKIDVENLDIQFPDSMKEEAAAHA